MPVGFAVGRLAGVWVASKVPLRFVSLITLWWWPTCSLRFPVAEPLISTRVL